MCQPLYQRLQKNPPPWDNSMTSIVQQVKKIVKTLPCLGIPDVDANLIVEIDASDIRYGGVRKQILPNSSTEQVVKYHSGIWHSSQLKYSTVKKENLSIVLCVLNFKMIFLINDF